VTIDQDKDVLAAEYVLGTLGRDERAEAQALLAIDKEFADVVRRWERRLGELSAMVDPVEPPADMWDRIKAGVAILDRSAAPAPPPMPPAPPAPTSPAPSAAAPTPVAPPAPPPVQEGLQEKAAVAEAAAPTPEIPASAVAPEAEIRTEGEGSAPALEGPAIPAPPEAELAPPVPPPVAPAFGTAGTNVIALGRRARRWRTTSMMTGTIAACFAALLAVQLTRPELLPAPLQPKAKVVEVVRTVEVPSTRPAEFVAVFQKDDASPAFLLTFDLDKRQLTVRRVGAEQREGRSYELWLVSDKYPAPRSLGVIGTASYTVRQADPEYDPVVINRATYAISLEPEGGSPTGSPTGPVLYHGRLLQTTAPDFPARTP
jgi:anti-sigma-K factor RskA